MQKRRSEQKTGEAAQKDWRRTIGIFTDDEGMKSVFQEALKLREADRKKAHGRAAGKRREKR